MVLRSSRLSKLSVYIIFISSIFLLFSTIFILIVFFYPILTVTNNFNNSHSSRIFAPWPMSPLDQEMLERKKLKRFAKKEQIRRMEKQLQKMDTLNIPIYDLFLDTNAEISTSRYIASPDETSFLWPILPGDKIFYNSSYPNFNRKSSSVIFPYNQYSKINEGILLLGGEEIKVAIPNVKGKRSLNFNLFLLTPGNIRINLGQYVWTKSFTDDDVQKKIKLSIPINDQTATSIKIISISSSFYLMNASVNRTERTGRSPIRVAKLSKFWTPNKTFIRLNQNNVFKNSTDETNSDSDESDEKQFDEAKIDDIPLKTVQNDTKLKESANSESIQDPLKQIANKQIITNDAYTTAFGYNIIFLQTPKISSTVFKNKNLFSRIAPSLSSIMEKSYIFNKNIEISENPDENFRKLIYSEPFFLNYDNPSITKEEINENKSKNSYYELRKYGYNVVGIAYPEAYYYSKHISDTSDFASIYGKWLEKNDWIFANKNLKIDDRNIQLSGLDAIFKTGTKRATPPLSQNDFKIISNYLKGISSNINKIPEWNSNEYILINNKESYIPKAIHAFQDWTEENQQTRFFAHILLDPSNNQIKPGLKDLFKSISTLRFSALLNPLQIDELSTLSYIDRGIGQILDTIIARKMENRTIIFLLIPNDKSDGKKNLAATGVFKIPGLIPKKNTNFETVTINDIFTTILSNVGIPIDTNYSNNSQNISGIMLEKTSPDEYKTLNKNRILTKLNNYTKYSMIINPNVNNCNSFLWNANMDSIFDFKSDVPNYQILSSNLIEIFPCTIKSKYINLSWYQKNNEKYIKSSNINEFLGGNFTYKLNNDLLPIFYFGKNLISSDNITFSFDSLNSNVLQEIFSVEHKHENKCQQFIKDNFSSMNYFESINNDSQNSSKATKIGFFITPL